MWHAWGEEKCTCRVLVVKPEGKKPVTRSRHGWEYVIEMDI
jgi:hypothetical protein